MIITRKPSSRRRTKSLESIDSRVSRPEIRRKKGLPSYFYYGFKPVFLVEKNKKTTTAKLVAAKALSFHFFFLIESICSGKTKEEKELAKTSCSLAHTKWTCKYPIIFTPKYRRKIIHYKIRRDPIEIFLHLCQYKGVEIIEGQMMPDHVHILVLIPPKLSIFDFTGCLINM